MKRLLFLTALSCPILVIASCSVDEADDMGQVAGTGNGTAGSGTAGSGVAGSGVAGSGVAGSGVAGSGFAGSPMTAGAMSTGGTSAGTNSGGTAGSTSSAGMTSGGTAGATTAGASGASGASGGPATAGTSGMTSMGGASGGTGGSMGGAMAGKGGSAAGAAGAPPVGTDIVGKFDGYLFTAACADQGTGFDCLNVGCNAGTAKTTTENFTVGGTMGMTYNVTLHVRGIVEGKQYNGGMRAQGTSVHTGNGGDFWHTGGTLVASDYNSYEIHVLAPGGQETAVYYLNSIVNTPTHITYALNFTKTFPVQGGGTIRVRVYDRNCRQIKNCGPTEGSTCANPRTINLSDAVPAPPATFTQPGFAGNSSSNPGQWVHFDVTSVM